MHLQKEWKKVYLLSQVRVRFVLKFLPKLYCVLCRIRLFSLQTSYFNLIQLISCLFKCLYTL